MPSAHANRRRPQQQKLFLKERHDFQLSFVYWKSDQSEVETRVEQPSDDCFRCPHKNLNLIFRISLPEQPQRASQLIDETRYSRGEMEGMTVGGRIAFKIVLYLMHLLYYRPCSLGQAKGGACRNQASSRADKELGLKFI